MIQSRQIHIAFLLCMAGLWLFPGVPVSAQDQPLKGVLDVIGTGRIHRDDVAKARDEAIAQGLWDAVERGVEKIISPSAIVSNFQLLSDRVYSRPEEFIHEYKVLTESKSGRYYRVVVQATLMTDILQDTLKDIGVLVTDRTLPSIVFILAERRPETLTYTHSWGQDPFSRTPLTTEETLDNLLSEKGFVVIRPGSPLREGVEMPYEDPVLPTDETALALGRQAEADVIIIGSAESHFSGNVLGTDMKSVEAIVKVRALRVDNGTVLGTFEATKASVHEDPTLAGNEAFAAAATEVAKDVNREIATAWGRGMSRTVLVELVVQGIEAYGDFVRFRNVLKNEVRGIKNVYLKAIKAGEANMDIELQGNTRMLSEKLMRKSFEGFGINIFDMDENTIRLELIPKSSLTTSPEKGQESTPYTEPPPLEVEEESTRKPW